MRDASIAPQDNVEEAENTNVLSASELLFSSGAAAANAQDHNKFMMNQRALAADAVSNGGLGGTIGTTKEESVDISNDFLDKQLCEQGMSRFDLKEFGAYALARYYGSLSLTLSNKMMSMDPTLKRADALSAAKINLG